MDISALMYMSVGLADVLGVVSATTHIALHLRHGTSRGNTKGLLVWISIIVDWVGLSRLLNVLVVRSTIGVVRNWGSRTRHSGVV